MALEAEIATEYGLNLTQGYVRIDSITVHYPADASSFALVRYSVYASEKAYSDRSTPIPDAGGSILLDPVSFDAESLREAGYSALKTLMFLGAKEKPESNAQAPKME